MDYAVSVPAVIGIPSEVFILRKGNEQYRAHRHVLHPFFITGAGVLYGALCHYRHCTAKAQNTYK